MEFFRGTNVDFISNRRVFYIISAVLIVVSTVSFVFRGVKLGLDFTGGLLIQVSFNRPIATELIRTSLASIGQMSAAIQKIQGRDTFIIKLQSENDLSASLVSALEQNNPGLSAVLERVELVGPAVGRWLIEKAVFAFLFSFLGIIVYVGFRFKGGVWGFAGVLALVHDVYITTGLLSLTGRELTLTVIASLLTLAGYSINDTIVVYDRIRENLRLRFKESPEKVFNSSINETLSRTALTSLTTLIAVAALYFLGSAPIRDFSFALLFGIIIGTYSSVFVASPIVFEWKTRKK